MNIEHFALSVEQPSRAAEWYCEHLGLSVVAKKEGDADTHFLADSSGQVIIEIYNNPDVDVPEYTELDPLHLHIAFQVEEVETTRKRLLEAGASPEGEVTYGETGNILAMLRDPWGLPIQLVSRRDPIRRTKS